MFAFSRVSRASRLGYRFRQHAHLESFRMVSTSEAPGADDSFPRFPGAVDSPFSSKMEWLVPTDTPRIPTYRILNSENRVGDPVQITSEIPKDEILQWYMNMVTIQKLIEPLLIVNIMDGIMFDAQRHGRRCVRDCRGGAERANHCFQVSHGEEALMIGSAAALGPRDVITCQYREHGVFLQRGFELKDFMSQLAANHNDPGKGRNMPNHYTGRDKVGAHSVASTLGTQIPHAAGAAYALKMQDREDPSKPPRVAAAYFGEGAASEGDFHGALNMAAMTKSPVIFICRNNGYAISTPAAEQYRGDGIASRGAGYGIETLRVDGTDIFAVYEATKAARRKALEDGGRPILLEFMSYRVSHHSTSDDSSQYRSQDEIILWKDSPQRNPVLRLRQWLEHENLWDADRDKEFRTKIRKDIVRELSRAEKEKKPALESIFTDVYAEMTEEAEAQREELRKLMVKYPEEYDIDEHVDGIKGL
ncbi:2-oxoisovalerate dehydrogenase subunit alpha, mitochondrial [Fusarium agapanthi]|uniref:2-oxoisovalerate dehydrogenase subunit alpha n=1 Tax=Fusarium agapanthi TaxID=1803897 RepID=A0A9P5EA36_9HYPO|nr:2-oxoisovalerate dehydrogenase subunit alpha, mitochondrial [Fusarium agapanthi]